MTDYRHALEVAVDAARSAGELLRADLHRPGGPRGSGSHADADDEAEALIRRRLLEGCAWGYLGEETGHAPPPEGETHYWLVDPNDGTKRYLQGFRGSAVSIAAIHEGRPVLGVVYAFAYPDHQGDLLAWAEGCGPVTRNGRPCSIVLTGAALEPGSYVLVSPDADAIPGVYLRCVAPARHVNVVSLAYRLALIGVGEGAAGISLRNKPAGTNSWDYAAGHAIVRGAGGTLLDQDGAEIAYDHEARGRTHCCFASSEAIARGLASRSWEEIFATADSDLSPGSMFGQTRLEPGRAVRDSALLARAQGCLLGQLAGDSLGSLVEFRSAEDIAGQYPHGVRQLADGGTWNLLAGQPTDDSELAMMLARSLVRDGRYDADAVRTAYVHWYRSVPFDVGFTTRSALGAGNLNHESQANGSLMRISPLGIFARGEEATALARIDSALTHPHPVCQEACAAFVAAVSKAVHGEYGDVRQRAEGAYQAGLAVARGGATRVAEVIERARLAPPLDYSINQGWVLIALQNAFYQLLHAPSLEEGVVATVGAGGDTDTNGAIAGALLGAVHGREAIPGPWRRAILACRPLREIGAVHRRPVDFWPTDVLELAERLLLCGRS
jgi:ADP-ribosylglycohydrolase/fructose-1,6-bisphosphatase/inositol monophosphatase family enzyme